MRESRIFDVFLMFSSDVNSTLLSLKREDHINTYYNNDGVC